MAAFTTQCPSCTARIKLQDKRLVGKQARCPKCAVPFTIKPASESKKRKSAAESEASRPNHKKAAPPPPPPPEEDDFGFLDDLTPDEFESHGDDGPGEFDDFLEEEPAPRPRRRDRSAKLSGKKSGAGNPKKSSGKKSSSKSASSDRDLVIGFIVLGVVALGVVGTGLYFLRDKISLTLPTASRMAWLPDDAATFVELDPHQLWASQALRSMRESKVGVAMHDHVLAKFKPLQESQIKRMAIGIPGGNSSDSQPVFVFYGMGPFHVADLRAAAPDYTEASHSGAEYFRTDIGLRAAYFPRPDVLVYGTEEQIKSAIDRKGLCAAEDRFDLPRPTTLVFASLSAGTRTGDVGFPVPRPPEIPGLPARDDLQQVIGAVEIDYDFKCDFTATCDSDAMASSVAETMNTDIARKLGEMEFERSERLKTDHVFKLDVGGIRRLFTAERSLLKSVEVSASGADVRLQLVAPNYFLDHFFKALEGVDPKDFGLGVAEEAAAEANPFAD